MKFAIVESGGKQYRAVEGGTLEVDRLPVEAGANVKLEQVFAAGGRGCNLRRHTSHQEYPDLDHGHRAFQRSEGEHLQLQPEEAYPGQRSATARTTLACGWNRLAVQNG